MSSMKVTKCPSDTLSMTNRVVVNPGDIDPAKTPHLEITTQPGVCYVMSTVADGGIPPGSLGFGLTNRKWATLSLNQEILVKPYKYDLEKSCISTLTVEIDFFNKKNTTTDEYNSDSMAADFSSQFGNMALTEGQILVFSFGDKKLLLVTIKALEASDLRAVQAGKESKYSVRSGVLLPNTSIVFNYPV